jgi:hypothetical protein
MIGKKEEGISWETIKILNGCWTHRKISLLLILLSSVLKLVFKGKDVCVFVFVLFETP